MRGALNRFVAAQGRQVGLWERYLAAQRPWQRQPAPLRWSWTLRGWRLTGAVLPELRPQCGRRRVERY
jgi:hypothetical protein